MNEIMENSGTFSKDCVDPGPLTFEKMMEAVKLLEKVPRKPFIVFSWAVPYDQAYCSQAVDKIIKMQYPWFNPKHDKGYMISKRYEGGGEIPRHLQNET